MEHRMNWRMIAAGLGCLLVVLASGCGGGSADTTAGGNGGSGGGGEGATGGMTQNADGMNCVMQMDQDSSMHQVCCKQAGEVPTKALGCGSAVAYGCELDTQCTFYTTDGAVTHPCPAGKSCNDCFVDWESGIDDWCGRQ